MYYVTQSTNFLKEPDDSDVHPLELRKRPLCL